MPDKQYGTALFSIITHVNYRTFYFDGCHHIDLKTLNNKNMKKIVFIFGAFLLGSFLLLSCKKNSAVPANKVAFLLKSMSSKVNLNATALPSSAINSSLTWESGFANITDITSDMESESSTPEGEKPGKESTTAVITKVDLFAQGQPIGNINIAPGTYANLNVNIEIAQTATEPALFLKGFYTNSANKKTPVEFSLNEGTVQTDVNDQMQGDYQHSDPGQIDLAATAKNLVVDTNSTASITLHFDKLMAGITTADLDAASQTGGVIVINKTVNVNIYAKIKANLGDSSDIN
jgi:hypothetical protein